MIDKIEKKRDFPASEAVFDAPHLLRAAMEDKVLAAEVLDLFLMQLPSLLDALEQAEEASEWAMAAHALKGSAATIGAHKLCGIATALEEMEFPGEAALRLLRLQAARAAAADFRDAARRIYPG